MIDKNQIESLIHEALQNTDRFLVDIKISGDNVIHIIIDSDTAVSIDHCIELSRKVEGSLDREKEDFELNVMSSGLDYPFHLLRQYKKYLGKTIQIVMQNDKKTQGTLIDAEEDHIVLQEETEVKQKKIIIKKVGETINIPLSEIKQAKAVINFN
ncbi:MAG: ribosome assembly cofactor RimP [Bacteroidales bacterium]|nr:ribosome assembly cofactor RimP [Bacteroidales bacterium]